MLSALLAVSLFSSQPETVVRMQEWSQALGVECIHCHDNIEMSKSELPTFDVARRMSAMVEGLNKGRLKEFGGITCMTCHRGRATPARLPSDAREAMAKKWAHVFNGRPEGLALTMSVYASSLGVECTHCHVEDGWASDDKPAKATARKMAAMFSELPTYFTKERMPSFQCYACHQGAVKPQR